MSPVQKISLNPLNCCFMKHKAFYQEFQDRLHAQYPSTAQAPLPPVSPFVVPLPAPAFHKIKSLVQTLYKMARRKSYQQLVKTDQDCYLKGPLPDSSLLMSYDFHMDDKSHPKLIEVNTHASGYLVSELVDQVHFSRHKGPQPKTDTALAHLKQSFEEEWKSFSGTSSPPRQTRIVDHRIPQQKMYVEFLMFQDLLNHQWHWPSRLEEISELKLSPKGFLQDSRKEKTDMIYNRSTDFYLQKWPLLKQAFLKQTCCISPQPKEYLLLADKARLTEWSSPDFLSKVGLDEEKKHCIQSALLRTAFVQSLPPEELWQNRKKLFFKPLRGYGGKAVYRGKNISRKMFERIINTPAVFQKAQPPPMWTDPSGTRWKYDIRAYVYRDKVQQLCARIYQGQLTGFQQPLSGFATIDLQ